MPLDLERLRKRLLDEQAQLNDDLGPVSEEIADPMPDDRQIMAANAPLIGEIKDVQARVADIKSDRIGQINAALQAMDDGTYGKCVGCGAEIDPRRLEADPAALTCIKCAEQQSVASTPSL